MTSAGSAHAEGPTEGVREAVYVVALIERCEIEGVPSLADSLRSSPDEEVLGAEFMVPFLLELGDLRNALDDPRNAALVETLCEMISQELP
jgi:hypothetical protein